MSRAIRLLLVLAVAATAFTLWRGWVVVPDRWNPWAPLRLQDPPNWLTRFKLMRLVDDGDGCRALLATSTLRLAPLADRAPENGCGWRNAVRIEADSTPRFGGAFTVTCPLAVSLALWERHALQPAAQAALGARVERIEHYGAYACRNLYGREDGRRSRHATAEAFDVAGFRFADGRRITIASDWEGEDARARFLRAAHRGACAFFGATLGPDYNAAHADHFHLDRGGFRVCR